MATTYIGYKPVLAQRNSKNFIGPKGKVGVYSNYELRDTGTKIFTGFPDRQYVMGTKNDINILEYIFAGRQHIAPMKDPGLGVDTSYMRGRPYELRATGGAKVFPTGYGHVDRLTSYSSYSNYIPDGLDNAQPLKAAGHLRRVNAGLSYGGAFDPLVNRGVSVAPMAKAGQVLPTGYTNPYGKNKVNEYRGLASTRAL